MCLVILEKIEHILSHVFLGLAYSPWLEARSLPRNALEVLDVGFSGFARCMTVLDSIGIIVDSFDNSKAGK